MTYVITEACIGTKDRSCVDVCPVDCIHDEGDDDKMLYIDPDECIDCGACEPACPVTAIFAEDDVPDNLAYSGITRSGTGQGVRAQGSTPSPMGRQDTT
jgi:NAD-dependent dihydropyrimidine dehydrogenase PreA subunit